MSRTNTANQATLRLLVVALGILTIPIRAWAAASPPLPTWPQNFHTTALERDSFGLPVTAAGAIAVAVHAKGAPIVVTLTRPDGSLAQQVAGTGELRINYGATAADVAVSPLWRIGIALQQSAPGAEASGSLEVHQESPIDVRKVAGFLAQGKRPDASAMAAMAAQLQAKISAKKLEFEQARAARQAARFEAIRPRLEAAKARASVSTRAVLSVSPSGLKPANPPIQVPIQGPIQSITPPPPPPPPPVIDFLGIAIPGGQTFYTRVVEPGDPIPISGSGFGAQGPASAVHFVVGSSPTPADDHLAPVSVWTDGEIFATAPTVTGYPLGAWAQVYVVRNDGALSKAVDIMFTPGLDTAALVPLRTDPDAQINPTALFTACGQPCVDFICHDASGDFFGHKGNDYFYLTTTLKNYWVVVDAILSPQCEHYNATPALACSYTYSTIFGGNGGVYIVDSRIGTASPYVNVHWWVDSGAEVCYRPAVTIEGPKGLPYQ